MKALFEVDDGCHGRGHVTVAWQRDGSYVASCGANGLVEIFDRHGQNVDEVGLNENAPVCCLDWDKDGETLAILQERVGAITLYDLNKKKMTTLDTGLKDARFLAWSKNGPQLAVGGGNGTLLLYSKETRRQETVAGKHSGAITCGAWSDAGNVLALGSEDKSISISSSDGSTLEQFHVRARPMRISFTPLKAAATSQRAAKESKQSGGESKQWAVGVSTKSDGLVLLAMGEDPKDMKFQSRYGKMVNFDWLSSAQVAVGFSTGQVVVLSTEEADFGEEVYSERLHRTSLTDLVVSRSLNRVASCGDNTVSIVDTIKWKQLKQDTIFLDDSEEGQLDGMLWTEDGQILSVMSKTGRLFNYLSKVPLVHGKYESCVAYLSSLREISIVDAVDMQRGVRVTPIKVRVDIEPSFLALGADHLAVGINNRVWFYRFQNHGPQHEQAEPGQTNVLVNQKEYLSSVTTLLLSSSHCAALCEGRVYLQGIERDSELSGLESKVFPEQGQSAVTSIALTEHFLIYGTAQGTIHFYSLADGKSIESAELRHEQGIRALFSNAAGTRIVFVDDSGSGTLYNPVDSQTLPIPDFSAQTYTVLWDGLDPFVFVTADALELSTYVYSPLTINGPQVTKVGPLDVDENGDVVMEPLSTQVPSGYRAIASFAGIVNCQTPASKLSKVMLGSHEALHSVDRSEDANQGKFLQSLALRKLQDAWNVALTIDSRPFWLALSARAMEEMNADMAIRVWRQLGDAAMVMALERIQFIEDKYSLAGHMAMLFGDYAQAQELFLLSPKPQAALEMRKDLLHWEQALRLAEKVAPTEIPAISVELAHQLEFKSEYRASLDMYQSAMDGLPPDSPSKRKQKHRAHLQQYEPRRGAEGKSGGDMDVVAAALEMTAAVDDPAYDPEENAANPAREELQDPAAAALVAAQRQKCLAGIARTTLRVGNIPKGVALAIDSCDQALCKECADILVSTKQFADAATLYEKAGEFEEAASIYIKAKNFVAAQPLLEKISAPRLHLQFAKAKEAEKDYRTALAEYEKGNDMDSVVRIALENLRQPEKAFSIVRKHQSATGAEMAARYCQSVNDFRGAIEFLLMAKRSTDAFELATAHDTMEVFESALGANGTPEEYSSIARFYETKQQHAKSAEFYAICGQFHKALKLYLQCNELEKAIEVVGKARSDMLTHTLIDYLMGQTTGVVQDPVHIFRLYMALGNYPQAGRTATVIAHQERENGNYRSAHQTLYETHRELESRNIRVPQSLRSAFLLLHSYLIVKKRIKVDDHLGAARLLSRVAKNISKFPSHKVPILTSTVIECHRGGLKKTAFEYASVLMRPEHRNEIAANFRKKIEGIVRRRGSSELEDANEERTECPYTGEMIPNYELVCPTTKNQIPFCIITGRHMVVDDWCVCPNSKMPALYSKYVEFLENVKNPEDRVDPILGKPVSVHELRKVEDPKPYLDAYSAPLDDDDEEDEA